MAQDRKPVEKPYTTKEVNDRYRYSEKDPLTLRPTAAYQYINKTKLDDPQKYF
jgi:hypothetical protein